METHARCALKKVTFEQRFLEFVFSSPSGAD